MIIAIHQIQFMPGLRFFSKMKDSDIFVFLDDVQYEKREFQNRNKIKTINGPIYLTVPVKTKNRFNQRINEVEINNELNWRDEHLKKIITNYSKAKYFKDYFPRIKKIYSREYLKLKDLAFETILFFMKNFNINKKIYNSSEFSLKTTSTERLMDLCEALKADYYLSGLGAKNYLNESMFENKKIKILWQDFKVKPYEQINGPFLENLSSLDLLLNCGEESFNYL